VLEVEALEAGEAGERCGERREIVVREVRSRSRGMSASASIAAALSPLKERLSTSRFGKPPTGTVREQRPLQSRWSSSSCGK